MKDLKKLSLNKEVKKEAEEIEKEVESRSDLDDIKVSDDMETSLFNKIQEYEYDKRLKKVHYRRKRRYLIVALAAVIVLVCGSVMTGVGSKSYWKVIWERITGNENLEYIDVENMDSHPADDLDEMGVYKEITKHFGVYVVRLGYKPENMYLSRYTLDEEQEKVFLFYNYNGKVIKYSIYMNDSDSSLGQKEVDKLSDKYEMEIEGVKVSIEEFEIDNSKDRRYVAEFEYKDIHYQLKGIMERLEFDEIIKKLIFF